MDISKNSDFYLSQINQNIDEKISDLILIITLNKAPKNNDNIVKIVEFGIGGGSQFKTINRYASCNSEIIGADILDLKNRVEGHGYGATFKKIDITNITEPKNSISIMNASAIFHEVFSYSGGYAALKQSFSSINKSIVNGGYLIYRDLLYPENIETKKVFYGSEVFYFFIKFFIEDFKKTLQKTGENVDNFVIKQKNNGLFLTASSIIHREIQRHYITFRDFCRNEEKIQNITGIKIIDHFFRDIEKGQKVFIVKVEQTKINLRLINKYDLKKCSRLNKEVKNTVIYKVNSEIFDLFYDDILLDLFSKKIRFSIKGLRYGKKEKVEKDIFMQILYQC